MHGWRGVVAVLVAGGVSQPRSQDVVARRRNFDAVQRRDTRPIATPLGTAAACGGAELVHGPGDRRSAVRGVLPAEGECVRRAPSVSAVECQALGWAGRRVVEENLAADTRAVAGGVDCLEGNGVRAVASGPRVDRERCATLWTRRCLGVV